MTEHSGELTARSEADARRARFLAWFGAWLVRLLGATWRIRVTGLRELEALRDDGKPVALLLWHGQILPLLYVTRFRSVACLVSTHKDGELIAQIAIQLGCKPVRGSSSRGADRALIGLIRVLKDGFTVAVTPDGPRGPYRSFAPGALIAAHKANAPVVAMAVHASSAWFLSSWDRFMIPKPFCTLTVVFDEPTFVPGETSREAAAQVSAFEARLNTVAARAAE